MISVLSPPLISHRQARHFLSSTLPRGKDNGSENATPSLEGEATTPCRKLQVSRTTYSSLLFCLCQIIISRVAQLSLKGFSCPACTPMFWFSHSKSKLVQATASHLLVSTKSFLTSPTTAQGILQAMLIFDVATGKSGAQYTKPTAIWSVMYIIRQFFFSLASTI